MKVQRNNHSTTENFFITQRKRSALCRILCRICLRRYASSVSLLLTSISLSKKEHTVIYFSMSLAFLTTFVI